jgi:hypothetical protein
MSFGFFEEKSHVVKAYSSLVRDRGGCSHSDRGLRLRQASVRAPTAPRLAISSTISMGTVSTAWIVDPTTRRVIFCRQSSPTGSNEQVLDFNCHAKPLP